MVAEQELPSLPLSCRGGAGCCSRDQPCAEVGLRTGCCSVVLSNARVGETVTVTTTVPEPWCVAGTPAPACTGTPVSVPSYSDLLSSCYDSCY